jgi:hypothetical protein
MELYVAAPDTADLPRDSDWPIAGAMYDSGIPLDAVELAFHIAFLRRYLVNLERDGYSPRIRSLAYFRAVINSFSPLTLSLRQNVIPHIWPTSPQATPTNVTIPRGTSVDSPTQQTKHAPANDQR